MDKQNKQELTLYQVIAILSQIENKDKVFTRVGDNNFKIFRGAYGDVMLKIKDMVRPMAIFNYIQDKWVLSDE